VKRASRVIRRELYQWARKESESSFKESNREAKFHLVIPVLKGLIASDTDGTHFEYRSELSYALSRKKPPDIPEAERFITEAIQMRDRNQHTGWRYFELRRARYRIQLDPKKYQSDEATAKKILADLGVAHADQEKWPQWIRDDRDIRRWLEENAERAGGAGLSIPTESLTTESAPPDAAGVSKGTSEQKPGTESAPPDAAGASKGTSEQKPGTESASPGAPGASKGTSEQKPGT
jgi:hypothetical protein